MHKYLFIVSRHIPESWGQGATALIPIEIECPDNEEALRHADTLKKRGDKVFAIFETSYDIWSGDDD